ncbi:GroES-like protein [Massarina eburnea CBS 473.64]|uniref:GroES-like protein n=1 Tax=Massarina eburnea CBS 473.64 TaxID=1395130 RepID=A0A6A6RTY7_9PLEO|nr:GroES-like protein [Massarina eburnea CBS 473.64]
MSNQSLNQAAWILKAKEQLQVKEAPFPKADAGQVVIKSRAIAINPVDWKIQAYDDLPGLKYPSILGCDLAGEVHEVGSGVTNVQKGDRVIGMAVQLVTGNSAQGAFQKYVLLPSNVVAKIPSSMSFTEAAVLPLNISTALHLLFRKETLGLPLPSTPGTAPPKTNKSVLVWGGSSSVGACAIQLAAAAGVKVVTVASAHNLENVKGLGASAAFDYKSPSVIDDIVSALAGTDFTGIADTIGGDAPKTWGPVYKKLGGRFGTVTPPQDMPEGIEGEMVYAELIAAAKEAHETIWGGWLEQAMEKGTAKALPPAKVVGKGLESLQDAMEVQKNGVSFQKIVVEV